MSNKVDAQLYEVFCSIQGEGKYLGERQVFVRFAGCNLACQYCDTQDALTIPKQFKYEATPGSHSAEKHDNPVEAEALLGYIQPFLKQKKLNHSVCLTGGEPLLQVEFLKVFLPLLKGGGTPIYLETNGTLPDHFAEVAGLLDIASIDVKLPSATGLSSYMKDHRRFIETALKSRQAGGLKDFFLKAVFVKETTAREIDEACAMISEINADIELYLQPVTPAHGIKHRPDAAQMLALQAVAKRKLSHVRVVPQGHKLLGLK